MNTFKKAALLTLVFANCAFYTSGNSDRKPSYIQQTKNFVCSLPKKTWNNKEQLSMLVGSVISTYVLCETKHLRHLNTLKDYVINKNQDDQWYAVDVKDIQKIKNNFTCISSWIAKRWPLKN